MARGHSTMIGQKVTAYEGSLNVQALADPERPPQPFRQKILFKIR
jgi:hypothetical protein